MDFVKEAEKSAKKKYDDLGMIEKFAVNRAINDLSDPYKKVAQEILGLPTKSLKERVSDKINEATSNFTQKVNDFKEKIDGNNFMGADGVTAYSKNQNNKGFDDISKFLTPQTPKPAKTSSEPILDNWAKEMIQRRQNNNRAQANVDLASLGFEIMGDK